MTISVELVCTHDDLVDEMGDASALHNLLPKSWGGSTLTARTMALRDVLDALKRRTPPVREADLQDVTELRNAVAYGALERIYRAASPSPESIFETRRKYFEERFNAECLGIRPTLSEDGSIGNVFSISLERR